MSCPSRPWKESGPTEKPKTFEFTVETHWVFCRGSILEHRHLPIPFSRLRDLVGPYVDNYFEGFDPQACTNWMYRFKAFFYMSARYVYPSTHRTRPMKDFNINDDYLNLDPQIKLPIHNLQALSDP